METSELLHVTDVKRSLQDNFMWFDYVVFVAMLGVCLAVGVYFGFVKRQTSSQDYLMGGRKMAVVPVTLSLVASYISGISLVGTPTEVYKHGTQYLFYMVACALTAPALTTTFLPVFRELQLVSAYGYLEKRFDRRVRVLGSLLFSITTMGWLPIVVYVPALAFNLVTGVNIHIVTPIVCFVCIFYTCVGGLKAVVWTDVIQTVVMVFPMALVVLRGALAAGGFGAVWRDNWDSGRLEAPTWSTELSERHSVWSLFVGGTLYALAGHATSQSMMQRYLALPSLHMAKRALWGYLLGIVIITGLCGACGLVLFAYYRHCDPLGTGLAARGDQLLPLLVMHVLGDLPGLPGLFVAGVFSAALSSLSTGLNSMAAVVLEDFWKPFFKEPSPRQTQILMRAVVVVLGCICIGLLTGLVFVVEQLGTVLQLTMSLSAASAGPQLALFFMGMFLPWINSTCALSGALAGLAGGWWLAAGAQLAQARGHLVYPGKPRSMTNCSYIYTPGLQPPDLVVSEVPVLFRMSYMWYCGVGLVVSTLVACLLSALHPDQAVVSDLRLYAPALRKFLARRRVTQDNQLPVHLEAMEVENEKL